jgi:enediyne biosynthesis protein E4
MSAVRGMFLVLCGCALAGCERNEPARGAAPVWFEDVTERVGLRFVHDAGPADGTYFLPQIVGSGAALFDFDNDGRLDLYLLQNGGPASSSRNRLYHQEADGTFRDVSAGSALDIAGFNMGVAVGDVNNDGLPDVLVTQVGGARLFLNTGGGHFTDVSREAGIDNPHWATSAAFVDYDRDGWLDLVIVNYVDYDPSAHCGSAGGRPEYCHPRRFAGTVARLFRNLGPGTGPGAARVRFEDRTLASGLGRLPGPGLGVACADFDGDGWPDIFVANDSAPNHLWINQHDGTFKEQALLRGVAQDGMGRDLGNMGVAVGDVRGSGLFDLFVTHLTDESPTLWVQHPRGLFQDHTAAAHLAATAWRGTGFGTVLADFDQDGAPDLAVVNGRVARGPPAGNPALSDYWNTYAQRNQLFRNVGAGTFADLSPANAPFCGPALVSRGLACGDVDGDGAPDLLVTTVAGPARLYRNCVSDRGHWLLVRALDPALHRDAYGATVTVRAGGRRRVGWVNPGQSYLCSQDPRVHFGLGTATEVEGVDVVWPDGTAESFPAARADHVLEVRKGKGRPTR